MKILFLILCTFLAYKNINACEYKPLKNITLEYLITSSLFGIFYFICIFLAHEIIRIYANKITSNVIVEFLTTSLLVILYIVLIFRFLAYKNKLNIFK